MRLLCLRRRGCRAGEHVKRRRRPAIREDRSRVLVDIKRTTPPVSPLTTNQPPGHSIGRRSIDRFPTLYLLNPTSLAKPLAVQQLGTDLLAYDIDIAVVTETWFKSQHADNAVAIPGYTLFRRDRPRRRGGGVAVYARSTLNCKLCDITAAPTDRRLELLWVQLQHANKTVVIGALYHPPKSLYNNTDLIQEIDRSVEQITNSTKDTIVILAGDFNQLCSKTTRTSHHLLWTISCGTLLGSNICIRKNLL